jgi:ADP-heptose:LPS heptosyltransferase
LYDNPSQFITKLLSNKKDKIYKAQDILIHIGYGGESSRNWGSDNREKLINYLLEKKKKIVLVYTDAEPEGDLLKEKFENKIKIVKNPTFKQFFDLLNQIDFYIGVDSGPFHLADLLAKPGLVLFSRENEVVR